MTTKQKISDLFIDAALAANLGIAKFMNAFNPYLSKPSAERDLLNDAIERHLNRGTSTEACEWRNRINAFIEKSWSEK